MQYLKKVLYSVSICSFCASNREGGRIVAPPNSRLLLYPGYDPGGTVDLAAFVVVQKVRKQSARDDERKLFNPTFRVLQTMTYSLKEKKAQAGDNGKSGKEGDLYTFFNTKLAEVHKATPFECLMMDSTGIGGPIASQLRGFGVPVDGMNMHRKNKQEIFSNLRILFEQREVELPDNLDLLSSLNCITAETDRIGGYVFSHPSGTHDDLAYALALAVWRAGKGGGTVIMMKDEPPKLSWRPTEEELRR